MTKIKIRIKKGCTNFICWYKIETVTKKRKKERRKQNNLKGCYIDNR